MPLSFFSYKRKPDSCSLPVVCSQDVITSKEPFSCLISFYRNISIVILIWWIDVFSVDVSLIDNAMIICAVIYNLSIIMIFLARAHERYTLEEGIGVLVSLLIIPFFLLWLLNLLKGRDSAHLITGFPIILFLLDDLWYRAIQKKKTRHKPKKWPLHLYFYFLLFLLSGMILTGYIFIVSLFYGFIVLSLFYTSWISYGYYYYRYKKSRKNGSNFS